MCRSGLSARSLPRSHEVLCEHLRERLTTSRLGELVKQKQQRFLPDRVAQIPAKEFEVILDGERTVFGKLVSRQVLLERKMGKGKLALACNITSTNQQSRASPDVIEERFCVIRRGRHVVVAPGCESQIYEPFSQFRFWNEPACVLAFCSFVSLLHPESQPSEPAFGILCEDSTRVQWVGLA